MSKKTNFLVANYFSSNFYYNLSPLTKFIPFNLQLKKKVFKKSFFDLTSSLINIKIKKNYFSKKIIFPKRTFLTTLNYENLLNVQFFFFSFTKFKNEIFKFGKNFNFYLLSLQSKLFLFLAIKNCLSKILIFFYFSYLIKFLLNF